MTRFVNDQAVLRRGGGPFRPFADPATLRALLFSASEPGFTFEPWDMTTLYQDRAGTTPVTAVGQSVGKRLDKSGRGNHEVAINDAARGVYGREPENGTRNRLTYTEQFDNAAWGKSIATVSSNSATAPDGTTTADAVTATAGAGVHYVGQTVSVTAATAYTLSFYAKAGTNSFIQLLNNGDTGAFADFDLATGTVGTVGSDTTASIVSVGSGWYRCIASFSSAATLLTSFRVYLVSASTSLYGAGFTAAGTETAYIWGAQLELGASATAYQKVVSQYDITEAGVASCYYVQTDGVDDAYVTPTITPGTDKAQVFAGVRKLSDAAVGVVIEHSASASSNNGSFFLAAPGGAGTGRIDYFNKGTVSAIATKSGLSTPITAVISGLGDISGDMSTLRVNGVQAAQSTADQGTGNYLAYPAYIYARGGTTLPFNGRDYGHAVRFGPNLDAATIARVEALIARNTPEVTL